MKKRRTIVTHTKTYLRLEKKEIIILVEEKQQKKKMERYSLFDLTNYGYLA